MNRTKIADASAIGILATMAMSWITPKGLGMLVSSGISGFDLMAKGVPLLIFTPVGALICLLILIYSETNSTSYQAQRRKFASARLICAIIAALPVVLVLVSVMNYNPMAQLSQSTNEASFFIALLGGLIPLELSEGIWLNLIAILVVGVDAFIDLTRV